MGTLDLKEDPTATTGTGLSGHELLCAFQSQAHDRLRPVSSSHYSKEIRQCALFDSDQGNARLIGREYFITKKIFSALPEDERKFWHAHDVEVKEGSLASTGIKETELRQAMNEVAATYGRVVQSSRNDSGSALPTALSQLMKSATDAGQLHPEIASNGGNRHASFAEEETQPQNGIPRSDEGIRPLVEQGKGRKSPAPELVEIGSDNEDEYLNDAVNRPAVHHMPTHVPALTSPLPENAGFLSETRSAKF